MKVVKQLSLFLENKPGRLAAVCRALADRKINIYALSVSDGVDHAVVRIVVDRPTQALHLLGEHGVMVIERDVLLIATRNRPGHLAALAQKLADHKLNIEYAYAASRPEAPSGAIVLRVDHVDRARRVLRGY